MRLEDARNRTEERTAGARYTAGTAQGRNAVEAPPSRVRPAGQLAAANTRAAGRTNAQNATDKNIHHVYYYTIQEIMRLDNSSQENLLSCDYFP